MSLAEIRFLSANSKTAAIVSSEFARILPFLHLQGKMLQIFQEIQNGSVCHQKSFNEPIFHVYGFLGTQFIDFVFVLDQFRYQKTLFFHGTKEFDFGGVNRKQNLISREIFWQKNKFCFDANFSKDMPKRTNPFGDSSPLQFKSRIGMKEVDLGVARRENMQSVYGEVSPAVYIQRESPDLFVFWILDVESRSAQTVDLYNLCR